MKIAVPVSGETLCGHFGQCSVFAFFDVDPGEGIVARYDLSAPEHQPGVLPRWLSEQGVDVVIAGGLGGRARKLLAARRVGVVSGAPEEEAQAVVTAYLAGSLAADDNPCTSADRACTD